MPRLTPQWSFSGWLFSVPPLVMMTVGLMAPAAADTNSSTATIHLTYTVHPRCHLSAPSHADPDAISYQQHGDCPRIASVSPETASAHTPDVTTSLEKATHHSAEATDSIFLVVRGK